jgi:tetratricopeptide (TPR) repeat protein
MRDVISLDPHNERTQFNLVLAAIRTSREDLVSSALENLKKLRIDNNADIAAGRKSVFSVGELLSVARTYTEIKNYKKALQYYKEIINISPEAAKHHFGIAVVYLKLNDKVNAIREAKKAAELDPLNYIEEVEKFINLIN